MTDQIIEAWNQGAVIPIHKHSRKNRTWETGHMLIDTHTNTDSAMKLSLGHWRPRLWHVCLLLGKEMSMLQLLHIPCLKHCEAKLRSTSVIFNIKVPFLETPLSHYISFARTEEWRMWKICSDLIGEIAVVITGMLCNSPLRKCKYLVI